MKEIRPEISNMNKEYLLSVIVPTRNRQEYALKCIHQVLTSTKNNVQIVIQDNSDENTLYSQLVNSPFFDRIKYNYTSEVLSFVKNFSQAVDIADGEYLCMIGDDDGINPEILDVIAWAKENDIEAITPEIKLNYIWPNTGISYYKNDTGNLMIIDFSSKCTFYNTEHELSKLLENGGQNYLKYNMVKIYHGVVKKSAMDKVKNITGKYFGGLSPDIYSSAALSLVIDKVLKIDYPLTIPGVCKESGSGQSSTGRHHGKLEEAPHFKGHENYEWATQVPKFYSVETIWADSMIAALKDMKRNDLLDKFNVAALTAYCKYNFKEYKSIIDYNFRNFAIEKGVLSRKFSVWKAYCKGPIYDLIIRIISKLLRKKGAVQNYDGIKDIVSAQQFFQQYAISKNKSVDLVLRNLKSLSKESKI